MKILVTGGAGFIGSNFICHVLSARKNYQILNYDKLTYAGNLANLHSVVGHPKYQFIKGDICDFVVLEHAMRGCDAVIHFAAESHVDRSIYEPGPVIQTNVTGTFTLLEAARKLGVSDSFTFPPTKSTETSLREPSPTKILLSSQAVLIPLPKLLRISS